MDLVSLDDVEVVHESVRTTFFHTPNRSDRPRFARFAEAPAVRSTTRLRSPCAFRLAGFFPPQTPRRASTMHPRIMDWRQTDQVWIVSTLHHASWIFLELVKHVFPLFIASLRLRWSTKDVTPTTRSTIATFRLEYEDDYKHEFTVESMRFRLRGRKFSKCGCSVL